MKKTSEDCGKKIFVIFTPTAKKDQILVKKYTRITKQQQERKRMEPIKKEPARGIIKEIIECLMQPREKEKRAVFKENMLIGISSRERLLAGIRYSKTFL